MPLFVACSSTVGTKELELELKAAGFDMYIEAPVSNHKIIELVN